MPAIVPFDPRRNAVSYTALSTWLRCRREAELRLQGWQPIRRKETYTFGSIMHLMLQAVYETHVSNPSVARKSLVKFTHKCQQKAEFELESYIRKQIPLVADEADIEDMEKSVAVCLAMLPVYINRWHRDFAKTKWLALESFFRLQLGNFTLLGIRDGVCQRKDGSLWILENKTTSRISSDIEYQLTLDGQNLFYVVATKIDKGKCPAGVLYNMIRRSELKVATDETFDQYAQRVAEQAQAHPEHWFARFEVFYSRRDVNEFQSQLIIKLGDYVRWIQGDSPSYRNEGSCIGRWGSCDFLQACASGTMDGYIQSKRRRR